MTSYQHNYVNIKISFALAVAELKAMSLLGDSQVRRMRSTIIQANPGNVRGKDFVEGGMCTGQLKTVLRRKAQSLHHLFCVHSIK